jgi:hypothetical protein
MGHKRTSLRSYFSATTTDPETESVTPRPPSSASRNELSVAIILGRAFASAFISVHSANDAEGAVTCLNYVGMLKAWPISLDSLVSIQKFLLAAGLYFEYEAGQQRYALRPLGVRSFKLAKAKASL